MAAVSKTKKAVMVEESFDEILQSISSKLVNEIGDFAEPSISQKVRSTFSSWNIEDLKLAREYLDHSIKYPLRFYPLHVSNWRHETEQGPCAVTLFSNIYTKYSKNKIFS